MADDSKSLHDTLVRLCRQLEEAEDIDPRVADRLRIAIDKVQNALDGGAATTPAHASLSDHLTESAAHFEQSHPTLFGTLHRLIDILGQMGI